MAHLNAPLQGQCAATRCRIALDDITDIERQRLCYIATPVYASIMVAALIGTANEVTHVGYRQIGDDLDLLIEVDRPEVTGLTFEMSAYLLLSSGPIAVLKARYFTDLDLIDLVIPANQQKPDLSITPFIIGRQHHSLDCLAQLSAQLLGHKLAFGSLRCCNFFQGRSGVLPLFNQAGGFGQLNIGGIISFRVIHDEILAGVRNHLKLMAERASDGASVGCHGPKSQAHARSEEHTSELQSRGHLVCRLLLEKK